MSLGQLFVSVAYKFVTNQGKLQGKLQGRLDCFFIRYIYFLIVVST